MLHQKAVNDMMTELYMVSTVPFPSKFQRVLSLELQPGHSVRLRQFIYALFLGGQFLGFCLDCKIHLLNSSVE